MGMETKYGMSDDNNIIERWKSKWKWKGNEMEMEYGNGTKRHRSYSMEVSACFSHRRSFRCISYNSYL